jgi:23S rRNA pseudouridine1911/1915/1917 synthase
MADHWERKSRSFCFRVQDTEAGDRLDRVAAQHLPDCSRTAAAALIRDGHLTVEGLRRKPGYRVRPGEEISGSLPFPEPVLCRPEPIPLAILYEDEHLLAIDKPPGMVVHPAPGHPRGTLVNALLFHCPELAADGGDTRPGIVHRLDKDTSGILLVAKRPGVQRRLSAAFKARRVEKTYLALVHGRPKPETGTLTMPIGRHPVDRKRMSTASRKARSAETSWKVRERLRGGALLEIDLKTGRTHQIRVHCAAMGHPVMGDTVYGRRAAGTLPAEIRPYRQMLHAFRLRLRHPFREAEMDITAPVPEDMVQLWVVLGGETGLERAENPAGPSDLPSTIPP